MSRRTTVTLALLAAAVAGGAAATWAILDARPAWTTASPEALAAFEAGEAAHSRLYLADAREHFLRAHRLDPDFAMPKLKLVWHREYDLDAERRGAMLRQLRTTDVAHLNRLERFLLAYHLATLDGEGERAGEILAGYLERRPDDAYAVQLACDRHWLRNEWQAASECYGRLIELDPDRLEAQNRIGYVSMATGDFDTAEQQFEIYRYLAPDQANPYDSLGELMMITGRYREAEPNLRRALGLKPDFCSSWRNLVRIRLLEGDPRGAAAVIAEMDAAPGAAVCVETARAQLACELGVWRELLGRDWQAAWRLSQGCPQGHLAFLAATYSGHDEEAAAITARIAERIRDAGDSTPPVLVAVAEQQRAYAALYAGDPTAAVAHAEEADRRLRYWSLDDQWLLKLLNGQLLADALAAAGRAEEAGRARAALAAVNPRFAERPAIPGPPPPGAAERRASVE